jgi:hypothetical protein
VPIGASEMTAAQRAEWLAKTSSKKAGEVTTALACLRDWAKKHTTDPAVIDVLAAMDRCAGDARTTVANRANDDLDTIMWAARHAGTLAGLWQRATAAKLARAAKALAPPSEQSTDTAEGLAVRSIARGEGKALRDELKRAKGDRARAMIGAIHDEADRADIDPAPVLVAIVDAITHRDDVVRYAAIDAAALASNDRPCDLSPLVPGLVASIDDTSKPDLAPGSGGWRSSSVASSARRALAHAVRWPASSAVAIAALRPLLDGRAKGPVQNAAYALAWGTARSGDWAVVAELLGSPKQAVRHGAVESLVQSYDPSDRVEVPASLGATISALRRDPAAAVVKLAANIRMAKGGTAVAADPRVLAEGLRSDSATERVRAIGLLRDVATDPWAIAAIVPWLVDGMGSEHREEVLQLVGRCTAIDGARWAPLLAGVLLDGDWTTARPHAVRILDRIDTSAQPWHPLVGPRQR